MSPIEVSSNTLGSIHVNGESVQLPYTVRNGQIAKIAIEWPNHFLDHICTAFGKTDGGDYQLPKTNEKWSIATDQQENLRIIYLTGKKDR